MLFGGLGEWFKPTVLKTVDRMMNAIHPFESDTLLYFIYNQALSIFSFSYWKTIR